MRWKRQLQRRRNPYRHAIGLVSLVLAAAVSVGCRGQRAAAPVAKEPEKPKGFEPYPEKTLTVTGKNQKAVFSPDGTSIFYLGSDRSSHSHWQIYQLFLANGSDDTDADKAARERRVTFHDGDVESVQVAHLKNATKIFYASATDEIKESPDFIRQSLNKDLKLELDFFSEPLPRTEIYESDLNGDRIERLTRSPGFDGDLALRPSQSEIVFVSFRDGSSDIFIHNTRSGGMTKVVSKKDHHEWSPALSSRNELAFARGKVSERTSHIYVSQLYGQNEHKITEMEAVNTDPDWHPGGEWIVFSANYPDPLNFELFRIRRDGKCLERLTYTAAHERFPRHSPDGKSLLFTRISGSDRQVMIMSGLPAPADCDQKPAEAQPG